MRGKKSYNIRNIEAHLNTFRLPNNSITSQFSNFNSYHNNYQLTEQQRQNEFINAKFGVSKYASNLVSGKMFRKI